MKICSFPFLYPEDQTISVSVDGLIWTFSEHSIDHTVPEIGEKKDE